MRRALIPGAVALAIVAAACTDGSMLGPGESFQELTPLFSSTSGGVECDVIDFNGFSHGDAITSVSLFGGDATLSLTVATAYDTELWLPGDEPNETHQDTQRAIECNDATNGGNGTCDGIMAVVPDADFDEWGDDPAGGTITISGFTSGYDWSIPSYWAVDDDGSGQTITLYLDGDSVAASSGVGDASVELVDDYGDGAVTSQAEFDFEGSGGIDNIEICRSQAGVGRMTGGGTIRLEGLIGDGTEVPETPIEVRFTHGFTLHCDILLSNNLEINWGGNQWHIEKESLEHVLCTDEPDVNPEPPVAPFDTFNAAAIGRLNGVDGSHIYFTLQDAGEPGGKMDKAGIQIWAPGADPHTTYPVLMVPFGYTVGGNLQAHYDQPHGNKPVK